MKAVILGTGQIGRALAAKLPNAELIGHDRLDIADRRAIETFDWPAYDVIINAAAYTNVDGAETQGGFRLAQAINAGAVESLAVAAKANDATLVHFSTDYVFDGTKPTAYSEQDQPNPQSGYAKTKLAGDKAASSAAKYYIFRTSYVYYHGGLNFVDTIRRLAAERSELKVVADQIMRPTYAGDIATAVAKALRLGIPWGLYNCQNSGRPVPMADFARAIIKDAGLNCEIADITADEYAEGKPHYAPRPAYSVLDMAKLEAAGITMPGWEQSLRSYIMDTP